MERRRRLQEDRLDDELLLRSWGADGLDEQALAVDDGLIASSA
jgi:hypothetical protein